MENNHIKKVKFVQIKCDLPFVIFVSAGPERMNVYISPRPNVTMTKWSISDHIPKPNPNGIGGHAYLVHYGGGKRQDHWTLGLDLKVSSAFLFYQSVVRPRFFRYTVPTISSWHWCQQIFY